VLGYKKSAENRVQNSRFLTQVRLHMVYGSKPCGGEDASGRCMGKIVYENSRCSSHCCSNTSGGVFSRRALRQNRVAHNGRASSNIKVGEVR
jgi:hypothetical protein